MLQYIQVNDMISLHSVNNCIVMELFALLHLRECIFKYFNLKSFLHYIVYTSDAMAEKSITPLQLYEEMYKIHFKWEKWLPANIFRYHDLTFRSYNSPISLQMGLILPFVSSLIGPRTKGKFFCTPSVLNMFWINVAASGTGKSQCRHRFVSKPLEYIMKHCGHDVQDFEVSKYTRAGK